MKQNSGLKLAPYPTPTQSLELSEKRKGKLVATFRARPSYPSQRQEAAASRRLVLT